LDCLVEINLDASLLGNYWILGGTFLKAFMTIYDTTNSKIGFVPVVDLSKPRSVVDPPIICNLTFEAKGCPNPQTSGLSKKTKIAISLGVLSGLMCCLVSICFLKCRKKKIRPPAPVPKPDPECYRLRERIRNLKIRTDAVKAAEKSEETRLATFQ